MSGEYYKKSTQIMLHIAPKDQMVIFSFIQGNRSSSE